MFDGEFIRELKQTNISTDREKTKLRAKELWRAASKEDKQSIENLAGISRGTTYRVHSTGSISAKLVVPLAQTLNVNPYYLTGEADEQDECSDALLEDLLAKHGYGQLLAAQKRKRRHKATAPSLSEDIVGQFQETPDESTERFDRGMREMLQPTAEKHKKEQPASFALSSDILLADPLIESPVSGVTRAFLDSLAEEDMILLLRSILLRAKSGMAETADLAEKLKLLLLS